MKPPQQRDYPMPLANDKPLCPKFFSVEAGSRPFGPTPILPNKIAAQAVNNTQSIFPQIPQTMYDSQVIPLRPVNMYRHIGVMGGYSRGAPCPMLPRRPNVEAPPLMSTYF